MTHLPNGPNVGRVPQVLRDERASLIRAYQAAEKLTPTAVGVPLAIRPLPEPAAAPQLSAEERPAGNVDDAAEASTCTAEPMDMAPGPDGHDTPTAAKATAGQGTGSREIHEPLESSERPAARHETSAQAKADAAAAGAIAKARGAGAITALHHKLAGDLHTRLRCSARTSAEMFCSAPTSAPQMAARPMPVPRNGTEFEKAWKSAAADPAAQAQLLKARAAAASALLGCSSAGSPQRSPSLT